MSIYPSPAIVTRRIFSMRYHAVAVITAGLFAGPATLSAQRVCHAADDSSSRVISMINGLMAPELSARRDSVGLPLASPDEIGLTTDSAVCARAGRAVDSLVRVLMPTSQPQPGSINPLYVFKIGSSFAVLDSHSPTNDAPHRVVLFFNALWGYSFMIRL